MDLVVKLLDVDLMMFVKHFIEEMEETENRSLKK